MAGPIPAASGRIFISYRREETAYPAAWLFDRLAERFGGGQVFKDVDSIQLGDDFVEVITRAVGSCDVLLTLIGNEWLTITDEHGRRRLDDPDDFVRLEIEAALTRNVRVIPILVDGARMPRADELPGSLAKLVRRQALELSPARFDFDLGRLLKVLDRTLAEVRAHLMAEVKAPPAEPARPHVPPPAPAPVVSPPARYERSRRSPRRWRLWRPRRRAQAERPTPAAPTEEPVQRGRPEPDDEASFTAGYPGVVTPNSWYSLSVYVHLGRLQDEADRRIADESRWFGQ